MQTTMLYVNFSNVCNGFFLYMSMISVGPKSNNSKLLYMNNAKKWQLALNAHNLCKIVEIEQF